MDDTKNSYFRTQPLFKRLAHLRRTIPRYQLLPSLLAFSLLLSGCMGESTVEIHGPELGLTEQSMYFEAEVTRGIHSKGDISYAWSLASKPVESEVSTLDEESSDLEFTCDVGGAYEVIVNASFDETGDTVSDAHAFTCEKRPELLSYNFAETRGRAGHGGTFPIDGYPVAGDSELIATSVGDVVSVTVIVKEGAVSQEYNMRPRSETEEEKKWWYTEISIPENDFTIQFKLDTPLSQTVYLNNDDKKSNDFGINIIQSDHVFYPSGDNYFIVKISNFGEGRTFLVNASDSKNYISLNSPVSIYVESDSSEEIKVEFDIDISDTQKWFTPTIVYVDVSDAFNPISISKSEREVRIIEAPYVLDSDQQEVVALTEDCSTLALSADELSFVLVGTKFLDIDKIDRDSIRINKVNEAAQISPASIHVEDVRSLGDGCQSPSPDGINDMLLTVNVDDLVSSPFSSGELIVTYEMEIWNGQKMPYFSKTDLIYPQSSLNTNEN